MYLRLISLLYLFFPLNELSRLGEIDFENPLRNIQMIRLDQKELSFLTRDQIGQLLGTISDYTQNPHVHLLVRISLATGARWGVAESLRSRHVQNGQLTFVNTKSGKSRSVPVEAELFEEIRSHLEQHGAFPFSLSAFRRAWLNRVLSFLRANLLTFCDIPSPVTSL